MFVRFRKFAAIGACTVLSLSGLWAGSPSAYAEAPGNPQPQASSTDPVFDERIAAFHSVNSVTGQEFRTCTASFLGDNWWLTAQHCDPASGDYLKQSDGERAEITEVHLLSEDDDIALLKVADGIEAKQFDLPDTLPEQGSIIDLIGFAIGRDFASVATLEVKSFIEKYPQGAGIPYKDLIVASSITPSRTCEGDSGGPGYVGNTIIGVHTAGGQNLECEDGEGRLSWLTALTPERVEWISSIVGRGAEDVPVINDEAESQWNLSSYLLLSSSWR